MGKEGKQKRADTPREEGGKLLRFRMGVKLSCRGLSQLLEKKIKRCTC